MAWFTKLRNHRLLFVEQILHARPTPRQREILQAMDRPGAMVAIRSGHGCGKSSLLSWLILHAVSVFDDCKVPVTATKFSQLRDVVWPELSKWKGKMEPAFASRLKLTSERLCIHGREDNVFAVPRTARPENPDALQGFHARHLLFCVDEASGVPRAIFEAVEGALTNPENRFIMDGNPTRRDGFFFDAFHRDRASWQCFRFNSEADAIDGPAYAAKMAAKYGKESNVYRVRVLGEFPLATADALILLEWVEAADERQIFSPQALVVGGVDVARYGDDMTALVVRRGVEIIYAEQWQGNDLMQTVGRLMVAREQWKINEFRVDSIGMGAGVVDRLRELNVPTAEINVSESAPMNQRFNKLRDELWWRARELYRSNNVRLDEKLPLKDELMAQLTMPTYALLSNGKLKVEGKDEMKARGVDSPNLADAHNMCLADEYPAETRRSQARRVAVVQSSDYVF